MATKKRSPSGKVRKWEDIRKARGAATGQLHVAPKLKAVEAGASVPPKRSWWQAFVAWVRNIL